MKKTENMKSKLPEDLKKCIEFHGHLCPGLVYGYLVAKEAIKLDDPIDEMEMSVEVKTSRLLALQQPMASDLRLITSCIRIAIDLERMSDLAIDIAELTERIEDEHIKPLVDTKRMAEIAGKMLQDSIRAFETGDLELAKATALEDENIDKLFYSVWVELIDMMGKDFNTLLLWMV